MTLTAWRIVKAKLAATPFDGEGARRLGGRWNSKGTRMAYAASSQALAMLEMLVHLESSDLLKRYHLVPISFDQALVKPLDPDAIPAHWNRRPAPPTVRAIGDAWIASGQSVVLQVPSVIVPGESNYLLNPTHPDFSKLVVGKSQEIRFDRRLQKKLVAAYMPPSSASPQSPQ